MASRTFLSAEWRNLLMANYAVDPALLRPFLPCRTELDTFNGVHYASLVGFLFANTEVMGFAIPGHRTFEEVNLRFYVRYKEEGLWKRGVVFLKEIVPRRAIAWVANTLYGENYVRYPMRHQWKEEDGRLEVAYEWKVGRDWNVIRARAEAAPAPLLAGSEEEFITEHYWGYTQVNDRCTGTYQVAHPAWRVHRVHDYAIHCDVARIYGAGFADALQSEPQSVFLAEGSPIQVMKGERIELANP
ncbi:YqjF family protein [Flaviaesturariibacter terrae]